jgi:hypothetical protein
MDETQKEHWECLKYRKDEESFACTLFKGTNLPIVFDNGTLC